MMQQPQVSLHIHDAPDTGVTLKYRGDHRPPVVEAVVENSPAQDCGLRVGLLLLRIQGMDTEILLEEQIEELLEQRPLAMKFGHAPKLTSAKDMGRTGRNSNNNENRNRGRDRGRNRGRERRDRFEDDDGDVEMSSDLYGGGAEAQRLLNRAGESDRRDERARRFGGGGGLSKAVRQVSLKPANNNSNNDPPASSVPSMRLKRAQSFADRSPTRQRKFIVGTCQQIEKAYFRLQGDVNPAWVRPEEVLTKSLDYVQNEWRKGTEWIYVDEQMRSIRQDLFVQGIETDFAIKAYSVGARIALEANDLGQFNQCQTQLKEFFQKGLGRNVQKEFWCYRLLYAAHLQQKVEEFEVLADACCREYRSDPIVKKCQVLRESLKMGNFSKYFAVSSEINEESGILDLSPPAAGSEQAPYYHIPFLLRVFLPHIRLRALALLTKAYGVPLQLKTVSHMIAFGDNHAECEQFLLKNKAVFDTNTKKLDCRKSNAVFQQAVQEKKVKLMG